MAQRQTERQRRLAPVADLCVRQQCHDQHLTSLEVVRRASLSCIRGGSGWIVRCLRLVVRFWRVGSPALGRRNLVGAFRRSRPLGRNRNDTVIALYVRICRRLIAVSLPCVIADAIPLFLVLPGGWGNGRLSDLPNTCKCQSLTIDTGGAQRAGQLSCSSYVLGGWLAPLMLTVGARPDRAACRVAQRQIARQRCLPSVAHRDCSGGDYFGAPGAGRAVKAWRWRSALPPARRRWR